ncbi:hypothetical protein VR45_12750 [Streptomyces sp. NRRL S-495]|nr:hypothetical protein VR45_12750 [Streptomyces sp. NRRL S-495]
MLEAQILRDLAAVLGRTPEELAIEHAAGVLPIPSEPPADWGLFDGPPDLAARGHRPAKCRIRVPRRGGRPPSVLAASRTARFLTAPHTGRAPQEAGPRGHLGKSRSRSGRSR